MKRIIRGAMRRVAPGVYGKLERLSDADIDAIPVLRARVAELEALVNDQETQLRETRMDHRRVVELYDVVFERLRADNPLTVATDVQR